MTLHRKRATASAFDNQVKQVGRAAAIKSALAGGASLSQKGRRIRFPGGGSRLTSNPGLPSRKRRR